jgi:dihydropteroate synthase
MPKISTLLTFNSKMKPTPEEIITLDNELSKRFINLDPDGYFIIYLDREQGLICAKHYTNIISDKGLALDPETGKPIPVKGKVERTPTAIYTGRSAKEIGLKITEQSDPPPLSRLDHALYLGREFVKAEIALISGKEYIQD